jgi:NitT/TauT family transport system permease protein
MVLWLGFGDASKIVVIFVGCMPPITLSASNGARGAEQMLIWSARSLGASRARVLWEIVLPSPCRNC